jgi:hypothetical protein
MESIHDVHVAVVLNSAWMVGNAGISIDSVNITIMAIRLKIIRMELVPFCLICTVFVSFIATLSLTTPKTHAARCVSALRQASMTTF